MPINLTALSRRNRSGGTSLPRRRFSDALAGNTFSWIAFLPLVIAVAMLIALLARARPILETKSIWELLAGQTWKPLQGEFGFFPFIIGTVWVTAVAMILAVPPCLLTAIYLAEYAQPALRTVSKPLIDLLAAIPSVVYGVWGVVVIVPWVEDFIAPFLGKWLGSTIPLFAVNNPTGFSILAGGIVLAVMVAPFIIAVTYEVMHTVPEGMREASLAVGATRWQTIKYAVLPRARPGIIAGVVLGSSRALGETMAVLMVVGNVVKVPTSIFDPAYPLPALIANNYGEMLSIPLYDAALLGAALILLLIVLVFNIMATLVLRRLIGRPAE
jgi:phosphate transport system permease protein